MKKVKIIFWIATIIIGLWEGVMPITTWIFAPELMTFGTKALGYPDYFAYSLAIAKVLGIIAIAYPKTPAKLKEWGYAGLTFTLIFAFLSHSSVNQNIAYMMMPLVFLAILAVSYINNLKIARYGKAE
jgi:hypothetical protein